MTLALLQRDDRRTFQVNSAAGDFIGFRDSQVNRDESRYGSRDAPTNLPHKSEDQKDLAHIGYGLFVYRFFKINFRNDYLHGQCFLCKSTPFSYAPLSPSLTHSPPPLTHSLSLSLSISLVPRVTVFLNKNPRCPFLYYNI
jgi:hypothetical protein